MPDIGEDAMHKMRKGDWRAVILMIMFSQILFLWLIDVSVPAMMFNAVGTQNGFGKTFLTNGWIIQNPLLMYHIALGCLATSFFLMALITIHHIDGEHKKRRLTNNSP